MGDHVQRNRMGSCLKGLRGAWGLGVGHIFYFCIRSIVFPARPLRLGQSLCWFPAFACACPPLLRFKRRVIICVVIIRVDLAFPGHAGLSLGRQALADVNGWQQAL